MLSQIALAAAGFSIVSLILLMLQNRTESKIAARLAKAVLLILISNQLLQVLYSSAYLEINNVTAPLYLFFLSAVGPSFYLYSQYVLNSLKTWSLREAAHGLLPVSSALAGHFYYDYFSLIYTLTFVAGGAYMAKLSWVLYEFRQRRSLFKIEFTFTALFIFWAVIVVIVGLLSVQAIEQLVPLQIIMLSLAVVAAMHIQLNYPHLLSSLEEMVSHQYQTSTLANIDCEDVKQRLEALISDKNIVQDADLSLTSLAQMLTVKPHQLSELLNTQLGVSFSAYLRRQRVKAAEQMLIAEPEASVLSIGLSVGFSSQSAFYAAFKEVNSMAPGKFRRQIEEENQAGR